MAWPRAWDWRTAPACCDVARQQCGLNQVIHQVPQGFGVASLGARNHLMDSMDYAGEDELRRLGKTFDVLARQSGIVLVDGVMADEGDCFPVPLMATSDIVVQVVDQRHLDQGGVLPDQAPEPGTGTPSVRHSRHRRFRIRGKSGIR